MNIIFLLHVTVISNIPPGKCRVTLSKKFHDPCFEQKPPLQFFDPCFVPPQLDATLRLIFVNTSTKISFQNSFPLHFP